MLLYLKIKPNQRFDRIEKTENQWTARIKAPAIDGKANIYLLNYLSEILNLPKSRIILKKGQTSRTKCLEIAADEAYVESCLTKHAQLNVNNSGL
jgi:uncharacterized protein YggU (UPF0235/DUF167 family)